MDNLKGQKQSSVACADTPALARHDNQPLLPTSDRCTLKRNADHEILQNAKMNIEMGSIYEIDHLYLPPRTPVQLKSIRVAMVSERTVLNVAVRYPSMQSLQTYFSNSKREMYPAFDEKFVMGTALASKVLLRQVPSQEFAEKKHLHSFWLVNYTTLGAVPAAKNGICLSQLKVNGMVTWGIRRQVKFLGRHEDQSNNTKSSSSFVQGEEIPKLKTPEKSEEDEEEEEDDEEEDEIDGESVKQKDEEAEEEDDEEAVTEKTNKNLKRKRYSFRTTTVKKKAKTTRGPEKKNKIKKKNKCRVLSVYKDPKDRWSAERYELAEKNLMEVMKAKGAMANNPIIRPELRAEARKRIGDTGLLDHLLKHLAGKIAPGGTERFRRRHNAEGAMEYWLESADLVNIRKEAGVNDPYWIPPPGWKLGDSPIQHPICAQEFKHLKDEIFVLKRDWEEMVSSKEQLEEEVGRLKRRIEELEFKKKQSQAIEASKTMEKYKKQLMMTTSDFMAKMEEKCLGLVSKLEEKEKSISALMLSTEGKKKQVEPEKQGVQEVVTVEEKKRSKAADDDQSKELIAVDPKLKAATKAQKTTPTAEEKAAKIQRLKSGFRICKPQGSFLWPNMVRNNKNNGGNMSNQVMVQVEDVHMVPTPPSVSSSTAITAPSLLPYYQQDKQQPVSPVKPVPERRAVTVTVSTISSETRYEAGDNNYSTSNKTTTLINLNDVPFSTGEVFRQAPTSRQTITTTTVMPHSLPSPVHGDKMSKPWQASRDDRASQVAMSEKDSGQQQASKCCSSSATSLPQGAASWLVLATPSNTDASDESIIE
uniref:Protein DYAD-like n=2 Tax=Nicotiana TaxID=4085 RepID=A0A1S3ZKP1_TOBAC|nr:PREDICTED: protein DYAD-like [Nicotiana tabacum]